MIEVVWLVAGAALLLVGQWWGTRLSRWRAESSKAYLESAQAVSTVSRKVASMALRESRTDQSLMSLMDHSSKQGERLQSIDETVTALWEYLKTAGLEGPGRRRPRPSPSPMDPAIPRSPMPTISREEPIWGRPGTTIPATDSDPREEGPIGLGRPS